MSDTSKWWQDYEDFAFYVIWLPMGLAFLFVMVTALIIVGPFLIAAWVILYLHDYIRRSLR